MSDDALSFHAIADLAALGEGQSVAHDVAGWQVLVCRSEGRLYAIENRCSHRDEPLEGGRVRRGHIFCPFHSARFALATGAVCSPPATDNVRTFALDETDGVWSVGVPAPRS